MTDEAATDEVDFRIEGRAGFVTLNRPKALHALSLTMCRAMIGQLAAWEGDDAVACVIVEHGAGRGFCAGGDVRALVAEGDPGGRDARIFFRAEYQLNHLMFTYAKPIVSFMDGVTMGGGVGIAAPARYRIATPNTVWAMPETAIGLFCDVGTGRYLSRLPGAVGRFLALTGTRLDGAECLALGLATHYLSETVLGEAKAAIALAPETIGAILDAASVAPPPARIEADRAAIDRLFGHPRLEDILAALGADRSDWAARELTALRTKAPASCKVAIRLLRAAARIEDFAEEMALEYALATRMTVAPDFREGVSAVLIAKHGRPRWRPPTPEAVSDSMIDALFAPLPAEQAWRPHRVLAEE
jgi:enoyl-CoA hydratase